MAGSTGNSECRAPVGTRFVIERLASGDWLGTLTIGEITVERVEKHLLSVYSHLLGSWWRELHGQETGDRRQNGPSRNLRQRVMPAADGLQISQRGADGGEGSAPSYAKSADADG